MKSEKSTSDPESGRIAILNAVKTPLSFFALVVLVMEAVLGGLAAKTETQNQITIIYLMVAVVLVLVGGVVFLTYKGRWDLVLPPGDQLRHLHDAQEGLSKICRRIAGPWWQELKPDDFGALSFVEISPSLSTGTVRMTGRSHSQSGKPSGQ